MSTSAARSSLLGNLFRGWDRFWFTPADPSTLAFIRICCGILVLYVHLTYSWDLFSYVGPDGWIDEELANWVLREAPQYHPPFDWGNIYQPITQPRPWSRGSFIWSIYYHVTDHRWIVALHATFMLSMLLFTLGLWTRFTGLISWIGAMSYVNRSTSTVFGLDTMMMIALLYLLIGPSGATFSLDRWLEKWRARRRGEPEPPVEPSYSANFAIRLMQVHFCIIYFAGGTSKLLGSTWWGATAVNLVSLNPSFAPLDWDPYYEFMKALAQHRWVWETGVTFGVAYTLLLEISFSFLVWDRRWRWLMVSAAVMLHTVIGLVMGLVTFSLMMLVMVSSFIPPEVIRAMVHSAGQAAALVLRRGKPSSSRSAPELVSAS